MKKVFILLTLTVAGFVTTMQAQTSYQPVPFDLNNSVWYEYYVDIDAYAIKGAKGNYYHFAQFILDSNDFYLDGIKYHEIIYISNGLSEHTGLGIREDTASRRIYVGRGSGNTFEETLLYDFSVNVGDTVKRGLYYNYSIENIYVVDSIDTVTLGGVPRKRIHFHDNDHCVFTRNDVFDIGESWIEGIGSTLGLFHPSLIWAETEVEENVLVCYSNGDSVIYHNSHFTDCMPTASLITPNAPPRITAYPNPAKDRITFDFGEARFSTLRLVNTAGATVLETTLTGQEPQHTLQLKGLPKGIYTCILSGKHGTATEKIVVE